MGVRIGLTNSEKEPRLKFYNLALPLENSIY